LFAAGALSMRGAGCIYNDIVDRDLDSLMVRTQSCLGAHSHRVQIPIHL